MWTAQLLANAFLTRERRRNFRHDRVICQEMNNVLELIYKGDGHTETIQDGLDKRPLTAKDLPRPGEVDLITAGFPWSAFHSCPPSNPAY